MYVSCHFLPRSTFVGCFSDALSMFILSKREKINKKMSYNIVINQEPSLPPKTKAKDQKRVEAARRGRENYIKKLKERFLKDNQEVQMTLKRIYRIFSAGPE